MRKPATLLLVALFAFALAAPAGAMTIGKPVDPCWQLATTPAVAGAQTITVANQANVKPANLCRVELAIQAQSVQLQQAWGTPTVTFGPGGWMVYLKHGHVIGPWGYHANPLSGSPPYVIVWTAGATYRAWSSDLSHEIIETLVDPYQQTYVGGTYLSAGVVTANLPDAVMVEIADPVHLDAYPIGDVYVADFVLPAYYVPGSPGPWDQMGTLTSAS